MMSSTIYDVAIIGGGLAGLSLAIQCANNGYNVALFEKEAYPFHKVCGEYISMESWQFLESLQVPLSALSLPSISSLQISDASGKAYDFNLDLGGFGISRHLLDNTLFEIAQKSGVTINTNCKVNDVQFKNELFEVDTQNETYKAKVAVGSFGKRSNIDIKLDRSFTNTKNNKLNNYIGVKYHIKYPQPINTISLHNFYNGYCGISNIEDGKCCLCYLTTADNLKHSGNSIKKMEENILGKNGLLKTIFTKAEFLYDQPLVISQISFSKKPKVENHVLMVGDAAGLITPLCGNGMSMALHASKIASHSINHFFQKKNTRLQMEQSYSLLWNKNFARRLWIGRKVQQFFGGENTTSLFLKTMNTFPHLAKLVISSTHGKPF